MVDRVVSQFGHIDILINNAGVLIKGGIFELSEADWDKHFEVNVKGYYLFSRAVAAKMAEQRRGLIVNIASDLAYKAVPGMGAYSVSKAAVIMLTRVFAQELGPYGIRVNAVAPGMFRTS